MAKVGDAPDSIRGVQRVNRVEAVEGEGVGQPISVLGQVWAFLRGPYPTLFSRLALGGIFLLYGLSKLNWPRQFANDIDAYQVGIPAGVVDVMARVLPVVEIGVGLWILFGLFTRFSAIIATALMTVFTVAITQAWFRGIDANCGCFSADGGASTDPLRETAAGIIRGLGPVGDFLSNEKIGPIPVVRDLIFLLMALHLVFVPTIFALDDLRKRYAGRSASSE
jgi:uncharacterized membrane protein YphA (DoxX/SURF4 family)